MGSSDASKFKPTAIVNIVAALILISAQVCCAYFFYVFFLVYNKIDEIKLF